MKFIISKKNIHLYFIYFLIIFISLYSFIRVILLKYNLFFPFFNFLRDIIILLFFLYSILLLYKLKIKLTFIKFNILDLSVFFIFLNYIFGLFILIYYHNFSIFIKSIHISIIPVLLFFTLKFILTINSEYCNLYLSKIFNFYLNISFILLIISMYFYFTKPTFYLELLALHRQESVEWAFTYSRFGGLFLHPNSYATYLAITFVILDNKINRLYLNSKIIYLFYYILLLFSIIISQSRGVWLFIFIYFLYKILFVYKLNKIKLKTILLIFFSFIIFTTVISMNNNIQFFIKKRIQTIFTAEVLDRTVYWKSVFNNFLKYPFGQGLGIGGQITSIDKSLIKRTNIPVQDGYFIKVISETGIISIITFSFFIISYMYYISKILLNYKHYKIDNFTLSFIILLFFVQSIGSNVFDFINISPLIWIFIAFFNRT